MKKYTFNVVSFSELSETAKEIAKVGCNEIIEGVLHHHILEIEQSYKASISILKSVDKGRILDLGDECIINEFMCGICYDYDFLDCIKKGGQEKDLKNLLRVLLRAERKDVFSDDYLADFFDANSYEFLENGGLFTGAIVDIAKAVKE